MPTPIECTTYHLQGERLKQKIGEIVLKGGDVLLLDTGVFASCNLDFWCISLAAVYELDYCSPPILRLAFSGKLPGRQGLCSCERGGEELAPQNGKNVDCYRPGLVHDCHTGECFNTCAFFSGFVHDCDTGECLNMYAFFSGLVHDCNTGECFITCAFFFCNQNFTVRLPLLVVYDQFHPITRDPPTHRCCDQIVVWVHNKCAIYVSAQFVHNTLHISRSVSARALLCSVACTPP